MAVEKLPSGQWRASVQHNGVRRRSAPMSTKKAAQKAEAELRLSLHDELGPSTRRPMSVTGMTIRQVAAMRLEQSTFSPTYEAEFTRIMEKLPDSIVDRQVALVTPLHAIRWWKQLQDEGWTTHRIQRAHSVLSSVFTMAIRLGLIRVHPLRDVPPAKPARAEIKLPTPETVQALVGALDEPCFAALVHVMLATGLRRGEVVGLKWGDLTTTDAGARITVKRAVSYTAKAGVVVKETKTYGKGRRTIPLNADAVAALTKWRAVQADRLTLEAVMADQFIFSKTGDYPHRPDWAQFRWNKLCERAGVQCHLHDLRHAFVSGLLEAGENPVRVARLAGHARTSTTLDIYGHLLEG